MGLQTLLKNSHLEQSFLKALIHQHIKTNFSLKITELN